MHFATFTTGTPLGHLQRALDELARSGFELRGLSVSPAAPGSAVRIDFCPAGTVGAETYLARIARLPGVDQVKGGPVQIAPADS